MKTTLKEVKNLFRIPASKKVKWCLIVEKDHGQERIHPGVMITGTMLYANLDVRRFQTNIETASYSRVAHDARKTCLTDGLLFISKEAGNLLVPKTFLDDAFGATFYSKELEGQVLL